MEAKQVNLWPCEAQAELEAAKAAAKRLRGKLATAEARLCTVSDENDRCRLDVEKSAPACVDKDKECVLLLECIGASVEEVNRAHQENTKLLESQCVIYDEGVKETLGIANARLNDVNAEKDGTLQSLRQEYNSSEVLTVLNEPVQVEATSGAATSAMTPAMMT